MSKLRWNGPAVLAELRRAQLRAVDETCQAAAAQARSGRSGRAAKITAEPAQLYGRGVRGRWGLFPEPRGGDAWYELFIESGNAFRGGDFAKRRAADAEYPQLASRIRRHRG